MHSFYYFSRPEEYPASRGYVFALWAVVRKLASAGNRLSPSSNGISALLESCIADQSCHNILFPQNSYHLTTDLTINFACKWCDEFHACTIENWTVVGRGYFSHTSSHSKNVASACRVPKEVLSHESLITPKTISHEAWEKECHISQELWKQR